MSSAKGKSTDMWEAALKLALKCVDKLQGQVTSIQELGREVYGSIDTTDK
jgi:hypothetical protein